MVAVPLESLGSLHPWRLQDPWMRKKMLKDYSHDSNTVKLKHMKNIMVEHTKQKADKDGLDPDTVKCEISTREAKVNMILAAAGCDVLFSKKKLQIKTEARYVSVGSPGGLYPRYIPPGII